MDVIAAPAEAVVSIPVDIGGEHGYWGARRRGRDDPGEGEEAARLRLRMEIVEPGALRRRHELLMVRACVAECVPLRAGLRVVAVGSDLHCGARAVLVKPADRADQLFLAPVTPHGELVRLGGVDAELRCFARADPLRPGVPQQAVGEE